MAAERRPASRRQTQPGRDTADVVNDLAALVARLSAVVFALALLYTLYAVFSGGLSDYPTGYTRPMALRLGHNAQIAGSALFWSSIAFCLCATILLWGWAPAVWLLLATGAALYVGLPYFGVPKISAFAMSAAGGHQPGATIVNAWRATGMVFFGMGGLFLLGWAWEQLQTSLTASRRVGGGLRLPFYSACWQTHYCKVEISRMCAPGRTGFRKSCWRHKSGCFCDASIGDKMLASARKQAGPDAEAFFGQRAAAPAPTLADRFRSTKHRVAGQTLACADCPIYNYHEVQKHRILAPVIIVSIPSLMYYYGDALRGAYRTFVGSLDRFALHLGFDADSTRILTHQIHGAFGEPLVEYMVYALACVLLVTVSARLLEIWCFEAKL